MIYKKVILYEFNFSNTHVQCIRSFPIIMVTFLLTDKAWKIVAGSSRDYWILGVNWITKEKLMTKLECKKAILYSI